MSPPHDIITQSNEPQHNNNIYNIHINPHELRIKQEIERIEAVYSSQKY